MFSEKLNTADPRIAEIAAMAGFPCIWMDTEHTANDYAVIGKPIMAAKIHGADALMRVPGGSCSDYIRPLELDASGIMAPHIMSVNDARDEVRITKFHRLGRRTIDGGNAALCPYRWLLRQSEGNRCKNRLWAGVLNAS
jgi:4-hydroxy-2-oxoheptanedioate aldolase